MRHSLLNKAILLITICLASVLFYSYSAKNYYIHGDALGYYLYLPSTFIYHNLKHTENLPQDKGINPGLIEDLKQSASHKTPIGYTLLQYTYGVALMESPFFFITHGYEKWFGKHPTGYSDPYNLMLIIASLTYAILGLFIVYKILRNYFTDTQSLLGVLLIFWATNMLWFSMFQGGMAHIPLFFLYASLMLLTIKLYRKPGAVLFFGVGFVAGLITIIRPVDILCLIIPLFYNVYNKNTLLQRIQFIKEYRYKMLLAIVAFFVPIVPQLLVWKELAGSYIFYSYGDQSFNWGHPKIIEGLFYFSNGWLPYAPVMVFAIVGIFIRHRRKEWVLTLFVLLPLYIYVIYCWYCYNYINGLGSRPMIHMYPLLAIPLCAFMSYLAGRKLYIKVAFATVCLFFVAMNIGYCIQKSLRILDSEQSNMAYNLEMLFKFRVNYNDLVVNDVAEWQPDTNKITRIAILGCELFDDSVSAHFVPFSSFGGKYAYHITDEEHSPHLKIKYNKEQFKDAKWLKCSGRFLNTSAPDYFKHLLVVSSGDKLWKAVRIENKIAYVANSSTREIAIEDYELITWGYVYFYIRVPHNLKDGDDIDLYVWNTGKRELYLDDLCMELYK